MKLKSIDYKRGAAAVALRDKRICEVAGCADGRLSSDLMRVVRDIFVAENVFETLLIEGHRI